MSSPSSTPSATTDSKGATQHGSLVRADKLVKHFPVRGGMMNRVISKVHAVNGITFDIQRGEIVGVVGESGCGKSTLGKAIIRLHPPTSGRIYYDGKDITELSHREMIPFRRRMQIIFQDPYSSLNPRLTVNQMLREVIKLHRVVEPSESDDYIAGIVKQVGLRSEARGKFPHEFSGGQRQRIGIARALCLKPEFIVADEPVSALDVSIQAQVLNLMMDLKSELGLTVLFISHDLKVIEHFCDRVMVMYLGHIVEELSCLDLHEQALHPYTKALLGSNPINDPDEERKLTVLEGDVPSPFDPPAGCPFVTRCPVKEARCDEEMPPLESKAGGQRVACWAVE